jgi:hypothetical protein
MAAVLTVSSYPLPTSPGDPGKWILESLLGQQGARLRRRTREACPGTTPREARCPFRERLEKHRTKPECASCHQKMDPPGLRPRELRPDRPLADG